MSTQNWREYVGDEAYETIKQEISRAEALGIQKGREEYRDHLCFLYRWISRLNGDKEHDRPEQEWKTYVACMVNYPDSPWQTGDWFEEPLMNNDD